MRYIFIVQADALGGRPSPVLNKTERAFREAGKAERTIFAYAENAAEAGDMAACFSEKYGSECMIFVCGAMEAVHECAAALSGSDTPMAVLPLGKGFGFASKLYGRETDAETAADRLGLFSGSPAVQIRRIDLGKCCGSIFIDRISFGFDGVREERSEKLRSKMHIGRSASSKLGFAAALAGNKKYALRADISVSSTANGITRKYPIRRDILFSQIVVSNDALPPSADERGSFKLSLTLPCNFVQLCNVAPMYKMGVEDISDMVRIYRTEGGSFSSPDGEKFPIELDGRLVMTSCAEFSVIPKALRLCLPLK